MPDSLYSKIPLCFLLHAVTICVALFALPHSTAVPTIIGDLDEDDAVTVSDLTLLVRRLQGIQILPVENVPFADANNKGRFSAC